MRHSLRRILIVLAVFSTWLVSACGGPVPATSMPPVSAPMETEEPEPISTEPVPTIEPTIDPEFALPDFAAAKFEDPTAIDNQYFPMVPGTKLVFDGFTEVAGRQIPHSIIFTVTDLVKEIMGMRTVVAYIEDYSDGQLVEAEIAFYAQANDGTVWFMGEYPEEYENGIMVDAPAWIPGFKGAQAGIVMQANPQLNKPSYAQGWGPAVNWTDRGHVVGMEDQVCVPVDCYSDVLVVEEFSQTEPDAFQVKYYAPGVGNIKVSWRGEDASKETLNLVEYLQLDPDALMEVRDIALALEAHAYEISKEVYDQTKPSEQVSP
jgi:hypothetical protein